jgi:hypothetical protein
MIEANDGVHSDEAASFPTALAMSSPAAVASSSETS